MKVYTKTGDRGMTSLIGGKRVEKYHPRIEAYGTVDELMSHIAYLRDEMNGQIDLLPYRNDLLDILDHLMRCCSLIAAEEDVTKQLPEVNATHISFLEQRIDDMQASVKPIDKFTLPGGHPLVSLSHICRTVCRRAERRTIEAASENAVDEVVMIYLNRLSDYFYLLGRKLSDEFNVKELYWLPNK